jgi:tRNA dimethylallyltransferase
MRSNPALLAIVGPTASGKSNLAVHLARHFEGEIVNCDSLQMYRHFDIGTGKPTIAERNGILHHLIDVLDPAEQFAAGEYARLAKRTISMIEARGKLPIVVGGTGFYLRALTDGLFRGPARIPELRERLRLRAGQKGKSYLHRILQRVDPRAAARIHPNDMPKTIRALEVFLETRRPISALFLEGRQALEGYEILKVGLNPPREALYEKINQRTRSMFENGLIEEVRGILAQGIQDSVPPLHSLGYSETLQYLKGKIGLEESIRLTQNRTRQYAKKQMTWFRKESEIHWIDGFGNDLEVQRKSSLLVSSHLAGVANRGHSLRSE